MWSYPRPKEPEVKISVYTVVILPVLVGQLIPIYIAILNGVSKVNRNCFGFAFFRLVIGPEDFHYFLNQSDSKLKPIATWSPAFSRALGSLLLFTWSSHWLLKYLLSSDWWLSLLWFWFYDTQFEHRPKKDDSSTLNMDITSCL